MKSKSRMRIEKIIFLVSVLSMLLFSASFLLMKPANTIYLTDNKQGLLMFTGAMFWITLAVSLLTTIIVSVFRKKYRKEKRIFKKTKPGIVNFFSNPVAKIADIAMIVFAVIFAVFAIFFSESYLLYIFFSLTIFSFFMHCVLNGENYKYINSLGTEENGNAEKD